MNHYDLVEAFFHDQCTMHGEQYRYVRPFPTEPPVIFCLAKPDLIEMGVGTYTIIQNEKGEWGPGINCCKHGIITVMHTPINPTLFADQYYVCGLEAARRYYQLIARGRAATFIARALRDKDGIQGLEIH